MARALRVAAAHAWFVEDEVAGLGDLVVPGAVCIDVGAEYGLYTWSLSGLVGATGTVHAVEPQPDLVRLLRAARRLLGTGNVRVHRTALGAEPGDGQLLRPSRGLVRVHGRAFLSDRTTGLGSNAEFRWHRTIRVAVETLDRLVARTGLGRLDLIKADIEGAEENLLAGGMATLSRFRPALLFELEDRHLDRFGTSAGAVVGRLADLGYRPEHWRPEHRRGDWRPGLGSRPGVAGRNLLFRADRPIA